MQKSANELTVDDLSRFPVWDYFEDGAGKVVASPVAKIPVDSLQNRLLGCQVSLNNGLQVWAQLSNIDLKNQKATSQFLLLNIQAAGRWFCLARYFDVDYVRRGPTALAQFLGMPVEEVFPISYDIAPFVVGAQIMTAGQIPREPPVRLSQDELIALTLD